MEKTVTNIEDFQHIFIDNEQSGKKHPTSVLIITSVDDHNKILSCLTPKKTEAIDNNIIDGYSINKKNNKRSLLHLVKILLLK
jgi:hypothetical protein